MLTGAAEAFYLLINISQVADYRTFLKDLLQRFPADIADRNIHTSAGLNVAL